VSVDLIALPLTEIVKTHQADSVMRNTVALGATIALLGKDLTILAEVIQTQFEKKGQAVIDENMKLAGAGFDGIKKDYGSIDRYFLEDVKEKKELLVMNASEAVGIGAIDGGLKFAAIYPMTPINALITLFADHNKSLGITYIQPEDEISGITMAIGASIAGVRSMVATSGGGYALMVEGLSLAGIIEVPIVIDLGMRPGPATGMPTYTEQGELLFAMFSGHGEFGRIILAPGDVIESYQLSKTAFDLAEQYQTPVFVLTDKYLNENQWCVEKRIFDNPALPKEGKRLPKDHAQKDFKRYDTSVSDGVSPRSFPGIENGLFITNSYEHDEVGLTTEDAEMRVHMTDKRSRKMQTIIKNSQLPSRYGDVESQITFVSFGSTKGPILEAMRLLKEKGVTAALLHFSWVYPLDGKKIKDILQKEKRLIDIEENSTGQFAKYLMMETGIEISEKLLKYDGRQWFAEEIVERVSI
jgi:2-oxoglutarate ferredoxin oxidoreductase subunit alpha